MKVLELFAESRSFSKVAEKYGMETYSTDYKDFDNIDQVCDIFDFNIQQMYFEFGEPDIIWASPPCTYFSVASIGHHWNKDHTPKTKEARRGYNIVQQTLKILYEINADYVFIENPRGKLRKLGLLNDFFRKTVCYCKYGDDRMKPTDIWTNWWMWIPRQMCHNGNKNCHHQPAPRGSQTGTQGLKGNYLRSVVPEQLCEEILKSVIKG
tara:strand:- start:261 stop:887 length:627 start_codon:yes stop_codon:yes gene_type:complete